MKFFDKYENLYPNRLGVFTAPEDGTYNFYSKINSRDKFRCDSKQEYKTFNSYFCGVILKKGDKAFVLEENGKVDKKGFKFIINIKKKIKPVDFGLASSSLAGDTKEYIME